MKPAVSSLAWSGRRSAPYYDLLAKLGITGLEAAPTVLLGKPLCEIVDADVTGLSRVLDDHGLCVVGLQSLYYGHPELHFAGDGATATALVAHSQRLVDLCCRLGAHYLLIGSPANRGCCGLAPQEAESRAAQTLHSIGEYARANGVWFTLEALDEAYGCELGCTLGDIARLIAMADSPGVRPHLDTGTTDPCADNPFGPSDFGSAQVSFRDSLLIADDPDQHRWANFLRAAPHALPWMSLELPPPKELADDDNAGRIVDGLSQMLEVFPCT